MQLGTTRRATGNTVKDHTGFLLDARTITSVENGRQVISSIVPPVGRK